MGDQLLVAGVHQLEAVRGAAQDGHEAGRLFEEIAQARHLPRLVKPGVDPCQRARDLTGHQFGEALNVGIVGTIGVEPEDQGAGGRRLTARGDGNDQRLRRGFVPGALWRRVQQSGKRRPEAFATLQDLRERPGGGEAQGGRIIFGAVEQPDQAEGEVTGVAGQGASHRREKILPGADREQGGRKRAQGL